MPGGLGCAKVAFGMEWRKESIFATGMEMLLLGAVGIFPSFACQELAIGNIQTKLWVKRVVEVRLKTSQRVQLECWGWRLTGMGTASGQEGLLMGALLPLLPGPGAEHGKRHHCRCLQMFADVLLAPAVGLVTSEPWPQCRSQLTDAQHSAGSLPSPVPAWWPSPAGCCEMSPWGMWGLDRKGAVVHCWIRAWLMEEGVLVQGSLPWC